MLLSRANSAPAITFAMPSPTGLVAPVPSRGVLQIPGMTAGQVSRLPRQLHRGSRGTNNKSSPMTHSRPRPPRRLTPYPERSDISHSLEPSPLSSPATSACSMTSGNNEDRDGDEDGNSNDEDVSDIEVDLSVQVKATHGPEEALSPGTKARADNARLLAATLHMSHLNSPTDSTFREMPPSPMRRLKMQSAASSLAGTPVLLPGLFNGQQDDTQKGFFSLHDDVSRMTSTPSGDQGHSQHRDCQQGGTKTGRVEVELDIASLDNDSRTGNTAQFHTGVQCGHVLQVHVVTVD